MNIAIFQSTKIYHLVQTYESCSKIRFLSLDELGLEAPGKYFASFDTLVECRNVLNKLNANKYSHIPTKNLIEYYWVDFQINILYRKERDE